MTRDANWLLFKWPKPGHAKGGIECPSDDIASLLDKCNYRKFESIQAAADLLLQEIPKHGFAIYVQKLADRPPNANGIYRVWVPSTKQPKANDDDFEKTKVSDQNRQQSGDVCDDTTLCRCTIM